MTLGRDFRWATAATLAIVLAAASQHAHAESGDGSSVYSAASRQESIEAGSAEAAKHADAPEEGDDVETASIAPLAAPGRGGSGEAAALRALVLRYAAESGIPFGLADAVIRVESRYRTAARNGPHLGLTQIHVATAQSLGYRGPADGLLDAETNLRYGLRYLGQAYKLAGGDTCGAILRFQAGHRARTMTKAARNYCAKVQTIIATAEPIRH